MADVCVIYARTDASNIPLALEAALSGLSVWWDAKIAAGDYRAAIRNALQSGGCVVPVWSRAASESMTLHDELTFAKSVDVPILPIRIHADACPPMGFGPLQTTDVLGWTGEPERAEVEVLRRRINETLKRRRDSLRRPHDLELPADTRLPLFFFSISSYETKVQPLAAVGALEVFGASAILVSAYDVLPHASAAKERKTEEKDCEALLEHLQRCQERGALILLDSGNYEKSRKGDNQWNFHRFRKALRLTPHDLALGFDELEPKGRLDEIVKSVVERVRRDEEYTRKPVVPIIHLPRAPDGSYKTELARELAVGVAETLQPRLLAIPERELGAGVIARAATMAAVRKELCSLYRYQPVHVLGTGNPLSVALLAAAGADSFDGLEWCRYAVDAENATLHHFQHFELFKHQDDMATSSVTANAAIDPDINYAGKTLFHNLDFYAAWIERLRHAVRDERRLVAFLTDLLPKGARDQARAALPHVL